MVQPPETVQLKGARGPDHLSQPLSGFLAPKNMACVADNRNAWQIASPAASGGSNTPFTLIYSVAAVLEQTFAIMAVAL